MHFKNNINYFVLKERFFMKARKNIFMLELPTWIKELFGGGGYGGGSTGGGGATGTW